MYSKLSSKIADHLQTLTKSKYAGIILAIFAFSEALFFPIPPDIILIPLALANHRKAFLFALITTIFSVLGGCLGYLIGSYFYEGLGKPILLWFGAESHFSNFSIKYNEFGAVAVFMGGLTPIPYKLVAILSGTTSMPIFEFVCASLLSRGIRFFLLAILIYFFHKKALQLIKKYFTLFVTLLVIVLLFLLLTFQIL